MDHIQVNSNPNGGKYGITTMYKSCFVVCGNAVSITEILDSTQYKQNVNHQKIGVKFNTCWSVFKKILAATMSWWPGVLEDFGITAKSMTCLLDVDLP